MEMRECKLFYLLDDSRKNDTFDFPYSVIVLYGLYETGGGALYKFWVRGRAIGKGIDFHDSGIRNGRGTVSIFAIFTIGIGSGMHFRKIGLKSGICF